MSWIAHVAHLEGKVNAYRVLVQKPEGRRPLGSTGIDGRIIFSGF
jgi:hypothetical protein